MKWSYPHRLPLVGPILFVSIQDPLCPLFLARDTHFVVYRCLGGLCGKSRTLAVFGLQNYVFDLLERYERVHCISLAGKERSYLPFPPRWYARRRTEQRCINEAVSLVTSLRLPITYGYVALRPYRSFRM